MVSLECHETRSENLFDADDKAKEKKRKKHIHLDKFILDKLSNIKRRKIVADDEIYVYIIVNFDYLNMFCYLVFYH